MNGRLLSFGTSGHPVAQFLVMIVMGVVLAAAVLMGAVLLMALLGLFVIGSLAFWVNRWWHSRTRGGRAPSRKSPGPTETIRYIEGEYEVVETDADAARRRSSKR